MARQNPDKRTVYQQAEPTPKGKEGLQGLLKASVEPLRKEVIRTEELGDEMSRSLRRTLDEILEESDEGFTKFSADQARGRLESVLPQWFDRRATQDSERREELIRLIQVLGRALKDVQGEDSLFHDSLEANLTRLQKAASGIQMRSLSQRILRIVDNASDELNARRAANEERIRNLSDMVQGLHQELDDVKEQLQEDGLTGLYNRMSFDERLERELNKARLAPYHFTLVLIDLDHFKEVNDTYGHVIGDRVLQMTAKAIQEVVLRRSDFCARYGGEEMAVILADCVAEGGKKVAEHIREQIEALEIPIGKKKMSRTASLGVAVGCDQDSAEDIISRADAALYVAKRSGRNKVVVAGEGEGKRIPVPDTLLAR